ncbi:xylulokinase [Maritalea mediterranea]|uniref:Xylulose kinase n=1 Tax=Maritalea mediterranea TaxID=2909667 RepID=A0ABS9E6H8_9HYPH|nr:xylulokinase [Maritalea mediterranea]MCF4098480.1 xylulokinase [Maritalea mediterranea]
MYLGLDLGTSGLRGLLIDEQGAIKGSAAVAFGTDHPHAGWSEQEPHLWIDACDKVLSELHRTAPDAMANLKGIGISGHMHGAVLLDKKLKVLRPCILWNDTRSHAEAATLDQIKNVRELSGNIVFPGFTAPKLLWVKSYEPKIFAKTAHVVLPKDYLRLHLTGLLRAEISDAAGSSWLNTGTRRWSQRLLEAGQIDNLDMPDLVEGSEPAGSLRDELRSRWGIEHEVMVVGGGADNAAAACGAGVLKAGQGFVSLGTSGVILVGRDEFAPQPETAVHTFCHAVPDRWYQMGVTLAATDSLNWYSKIAGVAPAQLANELGEKLKAPTPVHFLPYLSGERTPINDSHVRGSFVGLDIAHGRAELTKAVMQGVTFALRQCLEALHATGAEVDRLLAIGGGAQSDYWVQMMATAFNMPIDVPEKGDFGAALGAARLAICGVTGRDPEEVMTPPGIAHTVRPNQKLLADYNAAYEKFIQIYPAVRAVQ